MGCGASNEPLVTCDAVQEVHFNQQKPRPKYSEVTLPGDLFTRVKPFSQKEGSQTGEKGSQTSANSVLDFPANMSNGPALMKKLSPIELPLIQHVWRHATTVRQDLGDRVFARFLDKTTDLRLQDIDHKPDHKLNNQKHSALLHNFLDKLILESKMEPRSMIRMCQHVGEAHVHGPLRMSELTVEKTPNGDQRIPQEAWLAFREAMFEEVVQTVPQTNQSQNAELAWLNFLTAVMQTIYEAYEKSLWWTQDEPL